MSKTNKVPAKAVSNFSGKKIIIFVAFLSIFGFSYVQAQENENQEAQIQVNYDGQPPVDSDLDGLTDQAEIQAYRTDSKNPDTDDDGYYDGAEVLAATDPLDVNSFPGMPADGNSSQALTRAETPWPWYITRASGLVSFVLLYLSIFLGLTIKVPFLRKAFAPLYAARAHCWIALQATFFALIHGAVLLFDKFLEFSLADVFIPFSASFKPNLVALGIISFYLMVIITATSYGRKYISQKIWRVLHFTNMILYVFGVVHAYSLGTDLQNPIARNIFIYANLFLILIMLINMVSRIRETILKRDEATQHQSIQ